MDYSGYPEYPQLHPPFEHEVTVLDLLVQHGSRRAELHEELRGEEVACLSRSSLPSSATTAAASPSTAPTARGVDWNSEASQELRFAQLLKVAEPVETVFSLNDFGCGYGALVDYLSRNGYDVRYRGFDVSAAMLEHARRAHDDAPRVVFTDREDELEPADYTVASGIFNVRLDVTDEDWREYVEATLEKLAALSTRGFAFNMLTSYSDADKMRAGPLLRRSALVLRPLQAALLAERRAPARLRSVRVHDDRAAR